MSNQIYFDAMKAKGLADAADLQERSSSLDGTALYAEEDKIPDFAEAVKVRNMLERKAGQKDGFVCRSTAGRVVRLLQVYDSEIYLQEPEELPAQPRDDETPPPQDGEGPNEKPEQDRP